MLPVYDTEGHRVDQPCAVLVVVDGKGLYGDIRMDRLEGRFTDSMRIKDGDNTVNLAPPKETVAPGDATGSAACVLLTALTALQHPMIHASIASLKFGW